MEALRRGLCDAKEESKCREEMDEKALAWACQKCTKKRQDDLHPYTAKLLHLAALQRGGYPLEANDLTIEEWIDLGTVREALRSQPACSMMRRKDG